MARPPFRIQAVLKGAAAVRRELEKASRKHPQAVARALYQQGQQVAAEAVRRAPVEFGVLRTSAYCAPPTETTTGTVVEVGFGTVYAARQHEEVTWQHPRGGEAKYLSNALDAVASLDKVAAWARENVTNGKGVTSLPSGGIAKAPSVASMNLAKRRGRAAMRQAKKAAERAKRRAERKAKPPPAPKKRRNRRRRKRNR